MRWAGHKVRFNQATRNGCNYKRASNYWLFINGQSPNCEYDIAYHEERWPDGTKRLASRGGRGGMGSWHRNKAGAAAEEVGFGENAKRRTVGMPESRVRMRNSSSGNKRIGKWGEPSMLLRQPYEETLRQAGVQGTRSV